MKKTGFKIGLSNAALHRYCAVEKKGGASGVFFSVGGGDSFVPRGAHPMDHSVAEEASMVLQFLAEQLAGRSALTPGCQIGYLELHGPYQLLS